ncbi:MAG TPA: amidohydrolase [Actinomycetota bacterium]|nr:amidohydrolase [Actinomycetota bacterium]
MSALTVFTAKRFYTMEPTLPTATAVAVLDGRVAGVGTLADLAPWMAAHEYTIDDTFADQIVLPGFIDPHLHPFLPAVLSQMPFIAPDPWSLPVGDYPGATTSEEYWALLEQRFAAHDPSDGPFFSWGYHPLFHGPITRSDLDSRLSAEVPVVLWHRSFHELFFNTPALAWANIDGPDSLPELPEVRACVDLASGHFWETGLMAVMPAVQGRFMAPERIGGGLMTVAEMAHRGGLTTIADMGTGLFTTPEAEAGILSMAFERDETPFRLLMTPIETAFVSDGSTPAQALERCLALEQTSGSKVFFDKHVKLMADGAFYSQAFKLCAPGYIDGHQGEWIVPPEMTTQMAEAFWGAGYQIHIHVNGDEGAQFCLDLLESLFNGHPRIDHRFTMEHWGYCTEDQNRRLAVLGGQVSGQPYYVHMLGDKYSEVGMGPDRAHQISRFGSLVGRGTPLALHSDCPMAPLEPLRLAWVAANRETLSGESIGTNECLTVEQALRAITIDAAWILRLENQVGSIRSGKKADFTVLDADPFEGGADGLKDIGVVATVFEGRAQPV